MKKVLLTSGRLILLAIVFIALLILSGSVTTSPELVASLTAEQQARSAALLPLVGLIMSLCLSYLALRSRWHGWKLAGALFVILYGIYTFLSQIETAAFPTIANQLPPGALRGFFIAGLILAVPFSLLAVWILAKTRPDASVLAQDDPLKMPAVEWLWKLAAAAFLYVIVYLTFGYYVAWRTPGLPEFYGGNDPGTYFAQLLSVFRDTPWLPVLQVFRGLVWAAIGCIIIRMHRGGLWETALATGATFSLLMSTALILPNPFMPPFVARAHMIELASSNFLYGILLTLLMLWKPSAQLSSLKEAPNAH